MSTEATDRPEMGTMMVQAFLREVVGRFDVGECKVVTIAGGKLLIVDPKGEDLMYDAKGRGV